MASECSAADQREVVKRDLRGAMTRAKPVTMLLAAKKLKTKGRKRETKYFVK